MMLQYLPLVIVYCVRYHMLACTMLVWRRIINFSPFDNCVTVHSFQAKLDVEEIYSETWQTSPCIWKRQRYRLIFSQNCQACLNPYRYCTVWVEFSQGRVVVDAGCHQLKGYRFRGRCRCWLGHGKKSRVHVQILQKEGLVAWYGIGRLNGFMYPLMNSLTVVVPNVELEVQCRFVQACLGCII